MPTTTLAEPKDITALAQASPHESDFGMRVLEEPKVGKISTFEAQQVLAEPVVKLLTNSLKPGETVWIKGSSIGIMAAKGFPSDPKGNRHLERSSDIDLYTDSESIKEALIKASGQQKPLPPKNNS